jgi:trehalose 6-phosphate synthase
MSVPTPLAHPTLPTEVDRSGATSDDTPKVQHDLVVAANRLPVRRQESGEWALSPGGLVTAMAAVMEDRNGGWIGWSGDRGAAAEPAFAHGGMTLHPVALSDDEYENFYEGFSNATLWPLYHNGLLPTRFRRPWWTAYCEVNERFAEVAARTIARDGILWVHDYHLQLVPALVRAARPDVRIGFFLHTSFPPSQLIMRLPWRSEITEGLLAADVIGFQTVTDARNFLALASRVAGVPETLMDPDRTVAIEHDDRSVTVGVWPISIDVAKIETLAADAVAADAPREFRRTLGDPRHVILGVDRLDYTKGIGARLRAFRELLKDGELDPSEVVFVQVATPSRDNVPGYTDTRADIERLVGEINGDYASIGGPVVHYLHTTMPFNELVPMYLAADVMAVTPYQDGMNLVAKEFVASRIDDRGVLLLSEFAGASDELDDALSCNPFDIAGLKRCLHDALEVPPSEQAARMARMRDHVRHHDVDRWAQGFLGHLVGAEV